MKTVFKNRCFLSFASGCGKATVFRRMQPWIHFSSEHWRSEDSQGYLLFYGYGEAYRSTP
jgi:hypothetical protein